MSFRKFPRWDEIEIRKNPSYLESVYIGVVGVFFWAPTTLVVSAKPATQLLLKATWNVLFMVLQLAISLVLWFVDKVWTLLVAFAGRLSHVAPKREGLPSVGTANGE